MHSSVHTGQGFAMAQAMQALSLGRETPVHFFA